MSKVAEDVLKKPYHWVVVPDESGGFCASIMEFPGCLCEGESGVEALEKLRIVAIAWIDAVIEQGWRIPEPRSDS